jgi:hypothetical protein
MVRKLFLISFVLSATSGSLAAALPYLTGEGDCSSTCCRVVRHNKASAAFYRSSSKTADKLCCLMQCEHPADSQSVPEASPVRAQKESKNVAQNSSVLPALLLIPNSNRNHSPLRTAFASTHIYLKTGTLLI